MARSPLRYSGPLYIDNLFFPAAAFQALSTKVKVVFLDNSPTLLASRLCMKMRANKAVVFGPQRPQKPAKPAKPAKQGAKTQTYEDGEPLMFSFDEELEQEERQRRYIAPVHHLCTRPAQRLR